MAEPARQDQVIEMVQDLRDIIGEIDDALRDLQV